MEDYLIHYGVLGMKWGVRRYQNEDGTRTDLGKRQEAALRRAEKRQAKKAKKAEKIAAEKAEQERIREAQLKRQKLISQVNNRKNLSDSEIKSLTDRLNAEKRLRELSESELEPGKTFIKSVLKNSAKEAAEKIGKVVMLKIAKEITKSLGYNDVAEAIFQTPAEDKKKGKK